MKNLAILLLIILIFPGWRLKGFVGTKEDGADYVPATVEFLFGGNSTSGTSIKAVICDNSGTQLSNGVSSAISKVTSSTETGTFTGMSALTPGNTYFLYFVGNGFTPTRCDSSPTNKVETESDSYASPGSISVPGSSSSRGEIAIVVKNAGGDVLIGDSDFSDNTVETSGWVANTAAWFEDGYVCVTL